MTFRRRLSFLPRYVIFDLLDKVAMSETTKVAKKKEHLPLDKKTLLKAWELMCTAKHMSDLYNQNIQLTSKYVHATSRGHEAAQLALALQLKRQDFVTP